MSETDDKYKDVDKSKIKSLIEDFISDKGRQTKARKTTFDSLMSFTLDGKQWTSAEERERESDGLPSLVINESANFLDRYLSRLFPRNQRTGVLEVGAKIFGDDNDGKMLKKIMDTYRRNYLPAILIEQGINFLVGGASCLYYPQNPTTGKAEIISLNPCNCFLSWQGNKLMRFAHQEKFTDGSKEIIYADLKCFVSIFDDGRGDVKIEITENKFDFIPVSWIPSFPKPHQHEGRSKILALQHFDRENNERFSDFSKRVADNTLPHTNIFSDTAKQGSYKRGRKKVSYFGKDDDVRQEESKESPEVLEHLKLWDSRLRRKSGIVDVGAAIKSVVSGISLSFQFSEMMDLIGFMRIFWDKAFREINNAILNYEIGAGDYDTDPVYNPVLAFDSRQKVEEYDIMLRNKLISRKDAIAELRAVENPEEVIAEIIEEDKEFEYLNKDKEKEKPVSDLSLKENKKV